MKKQFDRFLGRFVLTFVAGVSISLVVVFLINTVILRRTLYTLNDHSAIAELKQAASGIEAMLSITNRFSDVMIYDYTELSTLTNDEKTSITNRVEAINALSKDLRMLMELSSSAHSTYLFFNDDWGLAVSGKSTRELRTRDVFPSERIMNQIRLSPANKRALFFSSSAKDFPLENEDIALVTILKTFLLRGTRVSIVMNLNEEEVRKYYAELNDVRIIRVVSDTGEILSSNDREELGTLYAYTARMLDRETVQVGKMLMNSVEVNNYGLFLVSEFRSSLYLQEISEMLYGNISLILLGTCIASITYYIWLRKKLRPLTSLSHSMHFAGQGDYSHSLPSGGSDELSELISHYNHMLRSLEELTQSRQKAQEDLRNAELQALRAQINPHFLYNTLNSIRCMADLKGYTDVAECLLSMGKLLGPMYSKHGSVWTLKEELELLDNYVYLMNMRLGGGVCYTHKVPLHLLDAQVPQLILQPIVENAILHGFSARKFIGLVEISAYEEIGSLQIYVDDDGQGASSEKIAEANECIRSGEGKSLGMYNVDHRIRLRYGEEYGILVQKSEMGGMRICIKMPFELATTE